MSQCSTRQTKAAIRWHRLNIQNENENENENHSPFACIDFDHELFLRVGIVWLFWHGLVVSIIHKMLSEKHCNDEETFEI